MDNPNQSQSTSEAPTEKASQPAITTVQWSKTTRYIAGVLFLLLLAGLAIFVSPIAYDLVAALLLAFLMDIPIRYIAGHSRLSYRLTALIAYALVYIAMAFLLIIGWRYVADYLQVAITKLGEAATVMLTALRARAAAPAGAAQSLANIFYDALARILQAWTNIERGLLRIPAVTYVNFVRIVINVGISVFLSNLLIFSGYAARGRLRKWVPEVMDREATILAVYFDRIWGNYLAGSGIFAIVLAAGSILEFWLLGVPYPVVFGILTGLICLLPLVGGFLSGLVVFIPCLLLGSSRFPDLNPLVFALIVTLINDVICTVSYNFIALPIIGKLVRLPYWVTLSGIMMGFAFGNILFAFLVIPIFSTLRVFYTYLLAKVEGHEPFPDYEKPTGPAVGYMSQFLLDDPAS